MPYKNVDKKIGKSKKAYKIIIGILLLIFLTFILLYNYNYSFRKTINSYMSYGSIDSNNAIMLNIDQNTIDYIVGTDNYFAVLKQNNVIGYVTDKQYFSYPLSATTVISSTAGDYLLLAEKADKKVYLFNNNNLIYEKDVGGNITQITVNKNGYVAVAMYKDGYRSVIIVYNDKGEEIFTTYYKATYASCIRLLDNNRKMAIVEVDTSGIKIASSIKFIEIDKLVEGNSVITTSKEIDTLITDMEFVTNDTVMYLTDSIVKEVNLLGEKKDILDISNNDILNVDIGLKNCIVRTEKVKKGIFNNSTDVIIVNRNNEEIGRYNVDGVVKLLKTYRDKIVVSIGQELYFLNSYGRPIKKYVSDTDIKDVIIYKGGSMAALIYRNKIEIIYI